MKSAFDGKAHKLPGPWHGCFADAASRVLFEALNVIDIEFEFQNVM